MFVKLLFKFDVSDIQVGFKVFKREVLEKVFFKVLVKKYVFDVEFLIVINMYGYKIYELLIKIEYKSFNFFINYRVIVRMFLDIVVIVYRKNILYYYNGDKR